jgi:hypothetical protein
MRGTLKVLLSKFGTKRDVTKIYQEGVYKFILHLLEQLLTGWIFYFSLLGTNFAWSMSGCLRFLLKSHQPKI